MRFVKIEEQFGRSRYSLPWGGGGALEVYNV